MRKSQFAMRILMIAPEPFFEPRGTPFSEFHRIRALTTLGHQVDLVTYPIGQDVTMPGLRVIRSLRPPFVHHVKIGPSFAKLPLDALLTISIGISTKATVQNLPRTSRTLRAKAAPPRSVTAWACMG